MSKKTLNKANLTALGTDKLADLLLEVSTGSADIKRRLRLELSHHLGASELASEVRKRLVSLRKAKSYISWRKRKGFIKDIETQHRMIIDKIAPDDPAAAFDLLWQFIEIAPSVYDRVDDSSGLIGDVFRTAILDVETLVPRALLTPETLADRVWSVVQDNDYGTWDGIITLMAPALGPTGLDHLKALVDAFAEAPLEQEDADHEALQFLRQLRGGATYAADNKARFVKSCLQEIAAAAGDTQAYVNQYSDADLRRTEISAEVAQLYLNEGRATDALALLQNTDPAPESVSDEAWHTAYIATLTALNRTQDAQTHRWSCFTQTLSGPHLRAYLKQLPDFEDVEAEERAKAYVLAHPTLSEALRFCLDWPDLRTAATLIETRTTELDGAAHWLLTPVAEALRARHPRAAVLLWRAMINDALIKGRSPHQGLVADHLADCAALDLEIEDYGTHPTHEAYLHRLQTHL